MTEEKPKTTLSILGHQFSTGRLRAHDAKHEQSNSSSIQSIRLRAITETLIDQICIKSDDSATCDKCVSACEINTLINTVPHPVNAIQNNRKTV